MANLHEGQGQYLEYPSRDPRQDEIDYLRQKLFILSDQIMALKARVRSFERYLNIPSPPVEKKFGEL